MALQMEQRTTFLFHLVPEFTLLAFTSALEVLRLANQVLGKDYYQWKLISEDGGPVRASCGLRIPTDMSLADATELAIRGERPRMAVVCGGRNIQDYESKPILNWIRNCRLRRIDIGSLCTGAHILARAGVLRDRRCTIHWENYPVLAEAFPDTHASRQIYEIDDGIYTCAGGTASLEMMLHIVGQDHGKAVAGRVSELAIVAFIRNPTDRQRLPMTLQQTVKHPSVRKAIEMMEDHIGETLILERLATLVGLSRRQIERLFQLEFNCSPARYYLKLRLERAKQLLRQTDMSVVDVAVACGFVSGSHFSKTFKTEMGSPPHLMRKAKPMEWCTESA